MRLIPALAGMTLIWACSDGAERRTSADDNLTRPLEVARVDTTQPIAPVEHQVKAPAQPAVKTPIPKAKRPAKKAVARRAAVAPTPPVAELDTSAVQAYAPGAVEDSVTTITISSPEPDKTTVAVADSTLGPVADTVTPPDTVTTPAPDTVTTLELDTAALPVPDTVVARTADTASTTAGDSMVGRDTSPPLVAPSAALIAAARTLPIGTEIHAALDDSINSRTDTVGRMITAVVMQNLTGSDGKTIIPAGAPVRFTVTRLSPARSKSAKGRLALKLEGIGVGGAVQKVNAEVRPVPFELRGRGVGTSEAVKVGAGAAGGAVLGRVIGGNTKGAVIGGVVGAAGGAVVASQTATRDVVVKARTPVMFVLTAPLQVK